MKHQKQIELLMQKAGEDEYVLDKIGNDPKASTEIFGFHAQQAAEKMLKALLLKLDASFAQTHRISDLIDLMEGHGVKLPEKLQGIRQLTPYAVIFRYEALPEEAQAPVDRKEIRELIRNLRPWVEAMLKKTPNSSPKA